MTSWGPSLWDSYPCVLSHVTRGGDELSSVLAKMVKERGEVEKEYAKNIRKLVTKYSNKTGKEKKKEREVETSHSKAFWLVLQEMGFQAGQHEVLSDTFCKLIPRGIEKKSKEVKEATQKNLQQVKVLSDNLELFRNNLDNAKKKYQKSFLEWEDANASFLKADSNPSVSRNEIAKLKRVSESLSAKCEDYKGVYASELVKTNDYQVEYYYKDLPGVINSLQNIEIDRIEYFKQAMDQCVAAEKQVAPIIDKCREDMENAIQMIDPVADSDLLTYRLKTGNIPPDDFPFEETACNTGDHVGTLGRKKVNKKINKQKKVRKLFPIKCEIEDKVAKIESDIAKGHTEIKALRVMIQSYTQNPTFGDPQKFRDELDSVILNVQVMESELHSQNLLLKDVVNQLEQKAGSQKVQMTPIQILSKTGLDSPEGSRTSSAGYGTISSCSNSDRDSDSLGSSECENLDKVVALYSYTGDCSGSSIAMEAGEEFIVTEGDEGGWTKVKRKNSNSEGFVPTSYLQCM